MQFHDKTAYVWMGILPLKKRVNRDKCSFATKQRMFGVFAIDEILRYRGSRIPGSPTLCHPAVRAPGWMISLNEPIGFQTVAAGAALPIAVATIFVEKGASSSTFEISTDGYLPNGSTLTHASPLELLNPLFLMHLV